MTVTINGTSGVTAPEVTLDNSAADGGQVVLKSSGYSNWNIDNYNGSLRSYYGSTVATTIDSSGNVGIGTSSPAYKLDVRTASGDVALQVKADGGGSAANMRIVGSVAGYNNITSMTNTTQEWNIGSGAAAGTMTFSTGTSERMRIDSSGNLLVGKTATDYAVNGAVMYGSGRVQCTVDNTYAAIFRRNTGTGIIVYFNYAGTDVGTISTNGSTTAYNTTSDYRLKENVQPMQNALDVVAQLNPVTYTWKADGSDGQGFIAHELQAVVPDCVTGEKDAVDEEGNPVYQGIDTSFLVATLTKAIQELSAKNDALEARIAALETK